MRTILHASAAALALIGLSSPAGAVDDPSSETHRERGYVLECTGHRLTGNTDRTAYVSLYENSVYGNYVEIVLDEKPGRSASRQVPDVAVVDEVRVGAKIRGHRARVVGNLGRTDERTHVHEEIDDAGRHIVSDGTHRGVVSDLGLLYKRGNYQLVCDPAFYYNLKVTTTETA
jgi:hypothetical protein